jgi:hypothetical protein
VLQGITACPSVIEVDRVLAQSTLVSAMSEKLTRWRPWWLPWLIWTGERVPPTWSGWRDSNPRPPAPKAGALTKLRYIPACPTGQDQHP